MLKEIVKIWKDTTTNTVTGEYSLKRLHAFWAYFFAMLLSLPFVVELHIWPEQSFSVQVPPMELIIIWLSVALGDKALSLLGKYNNRKTADANGQPLEPVTTEPKTENGNG